MAVTRSDRSRLTDEPEGPPDDGPVYSSWGQAQHGPQPRPGWVITSLGAIDTDLGVLKTGKEADVHLVERAEPHGTAALMAAKRYRDADHRMFHRDAGYLEGRRVRRSRETRAMARRTGFGRELISGQWAMAEFQALAQIWELTRPGGSDPASGGRRALVPYPVQLHGRELLMEFIGDDDGHPAPRLAESRPDAQLLAELWRQTLQALSTLARAGLAHGDLSPYNTLVHEGDLVLIDLPQVVDVVGNPRGPAFLQRDVHTMATWFSARGLPPEALDVEELSAALLADAGL